MVQPVRLLCLFLGCVFGAFAQSTAPPTNPTKLPPKPAATASPQTAAEEKAARVQHSIELLSDAGYAAITLDNHELAARLLSKAASLIWRRAPETASDLARKAYEKALAHLQDEQPRVPPLPLNQDLYERYELCRHIISLAQRNNKELGAALAENFNPRWAQLQETKRRLGQLASLNDAYYLHPWNTLTQSGIEGPQFLPRFGEQWLGFGRNWKNTDAAIHQAWIAEAQQAFAASIPRNFLRSLWYIADDNRAAADQLFLFLLHRIQEDETAGPLQLLQIALYPFGEHALTIGDGVTADTDAEGKFFRQGWAYYGRTPERPPLLHRGSLRRDEYLVYRFLQTALVVLRRTANNSLLELPNPASRLGAGLFLASWLEPRVAALQPKQLPALRALTDRFRQSVPAVQQAQVLKQLGTQSAELFRQDYRRDFPDQPLPVEAPPIDMFKSLTNRAEKSGSPNERDYFYQEAALFADREGPAEQALPLAEKISGLEYRRAVRAWLSFNAARVALEHGDYVRAQQLAEDLTALDQRVLILSRVAAAWTAKQREKALNLFNDLETELRKADNSAETLRAWLLLINSLTRFDRQRAFDALGELTRAANKLADFTLSDLRMTRTLQHPAGVALAWPRATSETLRELDWQQPFTTLAREDFDQVFGLVQAIEDRPLKVSAWLAVAAQLTEQKVKAPTPEPTLKK